MLAYQYAPEDVGGRTQFLTVHPHLRLHGLVVHVHAGGDGSQCGDAQRTVLAVVQGDVLLLLAVALMAGLHLIVAGIQLSRPGSTAFQFVVHVYLCTVRGTGHSQRGEYRAQGNLLHALAVAQHHLARLGRIARGLYAVRVAALAQSQADRAVVHLLHLLVYVHGAVLRRDAHHQIAHAVVDLLPYLGYQQCQLIHCLRLDASDAVVAEVDAQWHEVRVLDAQHVRAFAHIDPVLARLVGHIAQHVTLELCADGGQLHLHQSAGVPVQVVAGHGAGCQVCGAGLHLLDGQLLCPGGCYGHP